MKPALILWFCLLSCALAEPPWPEPFTNALFVKVNTNTLPPALVQALPGLYGFPGTAGQLPATLKVCQVDLNHDGVNEFLVTGTNKGWKGPAHMIEVFEQRGRKFVRIGELADPTHQGKISFGQQNQGWLPIVMQDTYPWTKRGVYRELQRYEQGKYQVVRFTEYRRRKSSTELDFVREHDPKNTSQ